MRCRTLFTFIISNQLQLLVLLTLKCFTLLYRLRGNVLGLPRWTLDAQLSGACTSSHLATNSFCNRSHFWLYMTLSLQSSRWCLIWQIIFLICTVLEYIFVSTISSHSVSFCIKFSTFITTFQPCKEYISIYIIQKPKNKPENALKTK